MKKFRTASGELPILHRNTANLMQSMLDEVKASITILPELKALIPPLLPTEFEQLTTNIQRDGCRETLSIWQTTQGVLDGSTDDSLVNILIDGHNRYEICQKHSIEFKIALREFPNLQAVRDFMIDNQLGRRNLTPEQMSYLRGLKYRNERLSTGRPTQNVAETEIGGEQEAQRTRDKLAKEFNVSPRTILRDRDYSEGLDRLTPELKQQVLQGTQKVSKDVLREIGRRAKPSIPVYLADSDNAISSVSPPLSLADLQTITLIKTESISEPLPDQTTIIAGLIKQIAQSAKALDPVKSTFHADCDALIQLLKEARKIA